MVVTSDIREEIRIAAGFTPLYWVANMGVHFVSFLALSRLKDSGMSEKSIATVFITSLVISLFFISLPLLGKTIQKKRSGDNWTRYIPSIIGFPVLTALNVAITLFSIKIGNYKHVSNRELLYSGLISLGCNSINGLLLVLQNLTHSKLKIEEEKKQLLD